MHEHGNVTGSPLKLSFNVHPQTGVDHCDSRYPQFAALNGVDPSLNVTIPCDFGNQTFIDALYKTYMDAAPLSMIDIWWTDCKFGFFFVSPPDPALFFTPLPPPFPADGGCGVSGGNPLMWNNLVIHQHQQFARGVRGQAFSRFGGLGNHRCE